MIFLGSYDHHVVVHIDDRCVMLLLLLLLDGKIACPAGKRMAMFPNPIRVEMNGPRLGRLASLVVLLVIPLAA
jgi:hypothetical protein